MSGSDSTRPPRTNSPATTGPNTSEPSRKPTRSTPKFKNHYAPQQNQPTATSTTTTPENGSTTTGSKRTHSACSPGRHTETPKPKPSSPTGPTFTHHSSNRQADQPKPVDNTNPRPGRGLSDGQNRPNVAFQRHYVPTTPISLTPDAHKQPQPGFQPRFQPIPPS